MLTEKERELRLIEAIAEEQQAEADFKYHIKQALELSRVIHQWGDDNLGHLREVFSEMADKYARNAPSNPSSEAKKPFFVNAKKRGIIANRYNNQCGVCRSTKDLCIDHIHPQSRGGSNELENLQLLCRSCNSKKRDKTMQEWLGGGNEQA